MNYRIICSISFLIVFALILIPAIHTPMLSDDYFYASIANLHDQIAHYKEWSGRLVTNIFSSYMMHYTPHFVYETLTALALAAIIFIVACIPHALIDKKLKLHPLGALIIFALYWIANPSLGETTFWFVGAANYLWTTFYISLFILVVSLQKTKLSWWKIPGALILGFAAGCSNENTSIVTLFLSLGLVVYKKNLKIIYPYLIGLVLGIGVLLLGPGAANRSAYFTEWHNLSLLGKIELQLFTRMPDAMSAFWQIYIVIILLAILVSMRGVESKKNTVYSCVFFISAILCNAAFIASPFMPPRAYSGALFMLLICVSFLVNAVLDKNKTIIEYTGLSAIVFFILLYFIPSYYVMTNAIIGSWNQDKIRTAMIHKQINMGIKDIIIPDIYMPKLIKATDAYPAYKHPARNSFFHVNSISEEQADFNYTAIDKLTHFKVEAAISSATTLDAVYFYSDYLSGAEKMVYKFSGDINNELSNNKTIYVHLFMNDGKFINKDTARKANLINGNYYTYSTSTDIDFKKIKKIDIGLYNSKTGAPLSKISIDTTN